MSLVSDLGMGRPVERVLRQTVIALRLVEAAALDAETRAAAYYTSLIAWVGCAADTSELARLYGDEQELYADTYGADLGGLSMAAFAVRHLGAGGSRTRRVGLVGKFMVTAGRSVRQVMDAHCQAAGELAVRLELGDTVRQPLLQAFERWDGRGIPGKDGGSSLAPAIRLVHLADNVEWFFRVGGVEAALDVAQRRRGTQFDPALVDCFVDHHGSVLDGLAQIDAWDQVIALDPGLSRALSEDELDRALEAFADFADLKSPSRTGHSRAVAALATAAAGRLGLSAEDCTLVRRAALVHDMGMIGVPSAIWEQEKPWTLAQRERARTHPYLTERMLARVPALADVARCAGLHHERLDGSGYPHGLREDALPMTARILAAADVYSDLQQPRPHRAAFSPEQAREILRVEARAGRLDSDVVRAMIDERRRRRARLPGGLTAREAQVLVELARGRSNPDIASTLHLSRKTVSSHLEHIYAKLGVNTRTKAALFAMRHRLVGEPDVEASGDQPIR